LRIDSLEACDYTIFNTEEQRQSLSCCNQEHTSTDDHHDRLLEILLNFCKYLIHSDN